MMPFLATDTVHDWLASLRRQGRSLHMIRAYEQGLRHFAQWYATIYGSPFTSAEMMPRDIRDWKATQQTAEKAARATINQRLVASSIGCARRACAGRTRRRRWVISVSHPGSRRQ
jgi:hypothetical protein